MKNYKYTIGRKLFEDRNEWRNHRRKLANNDDRLISPKIDDIPVFLLR